ncbi:hypothetical protein [Asaia astilbis]
MSTPPSRSRVPAPSIRRVQALTSVRRVLGRVGTTVFLATVFAGSDRVNRVTKQHYQNGHSDLRTIDMQGIGGKPDPRPDGCSRGTPSHTGRALGNRDDSV